MEFHGSARFEVATGEALAGPVPPYLGNEPVPPRMESFLQNVGSLRQHIRTESVRKYTVKVEAGWVWVEL
jgi:nitrite reductase/ring-hydroxylating ferredoxin subunit